MKAIKWFAQDHTARRARTLAPFFWLQIVASSQHMYSLFY